MCLRSVYFYFNLSPQGDGNPLRLSTMIGVVNFNLSPQGDGNVQSFNMNAHQTICYFNLSPQGDKKLRIKKDAEFFFCKP